MTTGARPVRQLGDLLWRAARSVPGKPALVGHAGALTYGELWAAASSAAATLRGAGLRRDDRVLISVGDRLAAVVWLFGTLRAGGAFVLVSEDAPAAALAALSADAQPRLAVLDAADPRAERLPPGVAVLPPEPTAPGAGPAGTPPPDGISTDLACLVYTSGSTSEPKGVMCPHRAMLFALDGIAEVLDIRTDDVIGSVLPSTFDYGLYQVFLAIRATATVALWTTADIPRLDRLIAGHAVTVLPIIPAIGSRIARVLSKSRAGAAVRLVTSTGEHLSETTAAELARACPAAGIVAMYGLTECKRATMLPPDEYPEAPGSVGRPLTDTEVMIVDPVSYAVRPPGATGEIVVRGPHVMAGYWRAPDATARRFRPWGPAGERVLFTGDLGHLDAEGRLYVEGRADDLVKVSGVRVSLVEVEQAACAVPGVRQAVAVPPTDDQPFALVVTGEVAPAEVRARLLELLEPAKVPARVLVTSDLPVTGHGKRDREAIGRRVREAVDGLR